MKCINYQSLAHALNAKGGAGRSDYESETFVVHALKGEGFDASEDGTGRGVPLVAQTLKSTDGGVDHEHQLVSVELVREVGVYTCDECGADYPAIGSIDPDNPRVQLDGFMLLANACPECGGQSSVVNYPPGSYGAITPISVGLGSDVLFGEDIAQPVTGRNGDPGCVAIPILEAGARTGASTDDPRAGMGVGEPGDPMFTLQSGKQHAVAFSSKDHGGDAEVDLAPTLRSGTHDKSHANAGVPPAIAFNLRGREEGAQVEPTDVASLRAASGGSSRTYVGVRRLTPEECEALQGFPRSYTLVPHRGKPAADGPRYRSLGNSMAVPVLRWIYERMLKADSVK